MAFVANDQEDDEQKQGNTPVSPTGGGAVHLAPSSGVGSTAPSAPGGAAPAKEAGGSFATLNSYLDANQGQAAPLANKITGQIGQQYNTLDQANNSTLGTLNNTVTNAPGYTASDSGLVAKESADPTSFANDPNNVASFQKQLTDSYGGPTSAEGDAGFQKQQASVNNAISQGQAQTQTAAGQQQLVAQNSKAPTAGVTALNGAILSQDPTYLNQVQNAYKPFDNLVSNLNTGAQGIDKTIASEQTDAANAAKNSLGAITGQENDLNNTVNNNLASTIQNATTQNATIKNDVASGNVTPQDLQTLGMTQDQWNGLSAADKAAATSRVVQSNQGQFGANTGTANIDNTQFLTQQDPNAVYNASNTATADQYGKAGAFQTLLKGLNLQTPQLAIDPANAAQAGTAPTNLNSFDSGNALTTAQQTSQQEQAAAQAYVDALQSGADENHAQLQAQNAAKNAAITNTTALATMGAAGPALVGSTVGQFNALKNIVTNPSIKSVISAPSTVLKGVESGVQGAVNTVSNIFCFHEHTPITMKARGEVMIKDIHLGDQTLGGEVLAIKVAYASDMYTYDGVFVTGKHAVYDAGEWLRIEDTIAAIPVPGTFKVYNLVTTDHRIWVNGVMFTDEYETDEYEMLNLVESLGQLNAEPVR